MQRYEYYLKQICLEAKIFNFYLKQIVFKQIISYICSEEKKKGDLVMTTLMMIFGGVLIGVGLGLMNPASDKKKPWKPKKKSWGLTDHDWDGPVD